MMVKPPITVDEDPGLYRELLEELRRANDREDERKRRDGEKLFGISSRTWSGILVIVLATAIVSMGSFLRGVDNTIHVMNVQITDLRIDLATLERQVHNKGGGT